MIFSDAWGRGLVQEMVLLDILKILRVDDLPILEPFLYTRHVSFLQIHAYL